MQNLEFVGAKLNYYKFKLMGVWYIIEIIHHKKDEGMVHGSIALRVCPQIHIGRESRSDLRLIWKEPSATFYYKIRLDNPNSPGSWISSGPHNGEIN